MQPPVKVRGSVFFLDLFEIWNHFYTPHLFCLANRSDDLVKLVLKYRLIYLF